MCIRDRTAEAVLETALERGRAALDETVHQNPVLEKAGVVDEGGFGLLLIWEGMLDACLLYTSRCV